MEYSRIKNFEECIQKYINVSPTYAWKFTLELTKLWATVKETLKQQEQKKTFSTLEILLHSHIGHL